MCNAMTRTMAIPRKLSISLIRLIIGKILLRNFLTQDWAYPLSRVQFNHKKHGHGSAVSMLIYCGFKNTSGIARELFFSYSPKLGAMETIQSYNGLRRSPKMISGLTFIFLSLTWIITLPGLPLML